MLNIWSSRKYVSQCQVKRHKTKVCGNIYCKRYNNFSTKSQHKNHNNCKIFHNVGYVFIVQYHQSLPPGNRCQLVTVINRLFIILNGPVEVLIALIVVSLQKINASSMYLFSCSIKRFFVTHLDCNIRNCICLVIILCITDLFHSFLQRFHYEVNEDRYG